MTTPTLKPGDRIELTVRGEVKDVTDTSVFLVLEGGNTVPTIFIPDELAAAKITVLEPELRVGRAEDPFDGRKGRVLHIDGELVWWRYDGATHGDIRRATNLRNIPEDQ